ncbi:MAG: glycosyltransferase [Candidatus Pacearchaeota archaeon]
MPYLSIIIPTRNEERYLPKLINSINGQTFQDLEIIVADAFSTDKTRQIAYETGCRVVDGGHPAIGRNNGARVSSGKVLCFIDADFILPDEHFIKKSLNEMNKRKLDIAGTLITSTRTGSFAKDILYKCFYATTSLANVVAHKLKIPVLQALIFVRYESFKKAGGFPLYEFGEDAALAKNAVASGCRLGILTSPGRAMTSPRRIEKKGFIRMIPQYAYFNIKRAMGHEFEIGKTRKKYF